MKFPPLIRIPPFTHENEILIFYFSDAAAYVDVSRMISLFSIFPFTNEIFIFYFSDAAAYVDVGTPESRVMLIDEDSIIRVHGTTHSYSGYRGLLQYIPDL